jgi:PAS domain S-box-containing protein
VIILDKKIKESVLKNYNVCKIIFDNTINLMMIIGTNGNVIAVNKRVEDTFDVSEKDILGKNIIGMELVSKEREKKVIKNIERVKKGEKINYETYFDKKNREKIFVDFSMNPIFSEDGIVIAILFEGHDITKRKRMEEELKVYQYEIIKINNELEKEKNKLATVNTNLIMKTDIINKELKEEKEKLKYYLDVAKVMFIIIGNDKKIEYINEEGTSVLEYSKDEIIGNNITKFIPYEKRENMDSLITGVLKEDLIGINGFEFDIIGKNGDRKHIECNMSLIYSIEGEITGIIISGNDRTPERILEMEREKLLNNMKEKVREIECLYSIAMFAQSGKELDENFVNALLKGWKNYEKLSGKLTLFEKEYKSSNFKISPIYIKRKLHLNGKNIGKVEIFFDEKTFKKENIENINNNEIDFLEVLFKMLENVAAGKELEERIIKNNIQLKETQEIAKLGSWEYNIKNGKIYWSEETYKIFGIKEKKNIDYHKYMQMMYPEYNEIKKWGIEKIDWKESNIVKYIKETGEIGYAVSNYQFVYKEKNPYKIMGSILDITEIKLIQMKLEKAMIAAESSNKAKSLFIANMSHEIRTPLNAILGFTQLLIKNKTINPQGEKQLKIILKSGEHLLSVINSILELAKIETGKIEIDEVAFDIKTVIKDVVNMFINQVESKGVKLNLNIVGNSNLGYIGDEKKIRQIYLNIIGNAVKFTEKGSIDIYIKIENSLSENIRVVSVIKDSGIGIPENYLDKVFQRFGQADNNIWKKGGTGLGLAITKEFIEGMKGKIEVRSKIDNGSEFEFEFFIKKGKKEIDKKMEENLICIVPEGKEYKALIVDDINDNIELLREILKSIGIKTEEAVNGEEAVKMSKEKEYDIIFMDVVMPVMDGISAVKEIRKNNKKSIIAAVTASVFEEERKEIMKFGVDEFIRKPYKVDDILNILNRNFSICSVGVKSENKNTENSKEDTKEEGIENIDKITVEELKDSVISGDIDRVIEISDKLKSTKLNFSNRIRKLAENYEFDELNKILGI